MPGPDRPGPLVVAIDGPAGSGKSTIARMTADALGLARLDTGAMYRAVTARALERGVAPADGAGLAAIAAELDIAFTDEGMTVDGRPVGPEIRTPAVDRAVSEVSAHPGVRRELVRRQREIMARGGIVAEGRDIGTVVYPDAPVKIFLTASPEERARRRGKDLEADGHPVEPAALIEEIRRRDELDSTRAVSPLTPADDAVHLDTTGMTPDDVVARIVAIARERTDAS